MSRIGKKPIVLPATITISLIEASNSIQIKGKFGSLEQSFLPNVIIKQEGPFLKIITKDESKFSRSYQGLVRVLIQNMIDGVEKTFTKILITEGIGYKFQENNGILLIYVGFTHPIKIEIPTNILVKIESANKLTISGVSKEKVGEFAAKIRKTRPPEPYKGKGIRYENELIKRKVGKTGK